ERAGRGRRTGIDLDLGGPRGAEGEWRAVALELRALEVLPGGGVEHHDADDLHVSPVLALPRAPDRERRLEHVRAPGTPLEQHPVVREREALRARRVP